jgi:tagaturonate reductase
MLSKNNLPKKSDGLIIPEAALFKLPEKVLQFGTGVLLRGLPDCLIDKANRQGIFNGRIAVVKSTATGSADEFHKQDGLYTLHIKGIENGNKVEEHVICSAISRVLSANSNWRDILEIAQSKQLRVIISNTTEVGLKLVNESIHNIPPASYPGKLLAVLYERYRVLGDKEDAGLVIIPTELVTNNGKLLKDIVLQLAAYNKLETQFIEWLSGANHFCNSLVDRIVPGKPATDLYAELDSQLGYIDDLRIVAEPYSLWAIEGGREVADILTFSRANDTEVVITPDIEKYRELKLRLLNGTHTLCCALAYLSGFNTVDEAISNSAFSRFIRQLMGEIASAIPYPIDKNETEQFAHKVLDRFSNPYIKHQWLSISVQYSLKMHIRILPLLLSYKKLFNTYPTAMTLGFAAFIRFMKVEKTGDYFEGSFNGVSYTVTDANANIFYEAWKNESYTDVVGAILSNVNLWGEDLSQLSGFNKQLTDMLDEVTTHGMLNLAQITLAEDG